MSAVRRAGRVTAELLPAAALTRLGVPALAAAVFLAVLTLGAACWVIASGDRSDRITRMIDARHGRSLPRGSPAAPARASRRKPADPPAAPARASRRKPANPPAAPT
jgi:hypothetical protein